MNKTESDIKSKHAKKDKNWITYIIYTTKMF